MKKTDIRTKLRGEFYRGNKAVFLIAVFSSILTGTLGISASWIVKLFVDAASGAEGAYPLRMLARLSIGFIAFGIAENMLGVF